MKKDPLDLRAERPPVVQGHLRREARLREVERQLWSLRWKERVFLGGGVPGFLVVGVLIPLLRMPWPPRHTVAWILTLVMCLGGIWRSWDHVRQRISQLDLEREVLLDGEDRPLRQGNDMQTESTS